ncbi:pseudouridine synthase [Iodidimonas sp. SYSU 1G8]
MNEKTGDKDGERIAKVLARAGVASRRAAETMIEQRRVAVDGKVLDSPALNVRPEQIITVDGKPIAAAEPTRLWLYHKPPGLLTSHKDPKGRNTVFENLPKDMPRVISVGRLDINSEGLLLLTNDGELARHLESPKTGWKRRYRARAWGEPDDKRLEALRKGVVVDGVKYAPAEVEVESRKASNTWIAVGIREGKNREVRKLLEHAGLQVSRLIRVAYGPFQLGVLERGEVREVHRPVLRQQLGAAFQLKAK